MEAMAAETVFGKIVSGEIPVDILAETDRVIAFPDMHPQAAVHILVIPKATQYRDIVELAAADPDTLAEMITVAQQLADKHADGHFRLIFNTGENAGQTVFHVHAHVLAGEFKEHSLVGS